MLAKADCFGQPSLILASYTLPNSVSRLCNLGNFLVPSDGAQLHLPIPASRPNCFHIGKITFANQSSFGILISEHIFSVSALDEPIRTAEGNMDFIWPMFAIVGIPLVIVVLWAVRAMVHCFRRRSRATRLCESRPHIKIRLRTIASVSSVSLDAGLTDMLDTAIDNVYIGNL
jgi:hypothetical protein